MMSSLIALMIPIGANSQHGIKSVDVTINA